MHRSATLIVLDRDGAPLGAFGPIVANRDVRDPTELVERARAAGLELTILRLLGEPERTGDDVRHGVYTAEVLGAVPANVLGTVPADVRLDDHPLRLPYARPGGIAGDLRWADSTLRSAGRRRVGRALQQRTWNLSCVHRLSLDDGATAWLKVVPPFRRRG